jgi:hypothetical protein
LLRWRKYFTDLKKTLKHHHALLWLRRALGAVRRDLAEVRYGVLVVALFGATFVVAARAVVLFGFAFDFFVVETFLEEACIFGAAVAGFAFRRCDSVVRFLTVPIAAPESAPITVPTTGTPIQRPRLSTQRASHRAFFCLSGVFVLSFVMLLPKV